MLFNDSDKVNDFIDLQPQKTFSPSFVTEFGMATAVRDSQL